MTSMRPREGLMQIAAGPRAEASPMPAAVTAGVVTAAAAGWFVLVERMAGMDGGPGGDPGALGWFAVTWTVMTVAMMLPTSLPAVSRVARARSVPAPGTAAAVFLAGYGVVWLLAGLAGYAVIEAVRGLHLSVLAWSSAGRYVAGASVAAAGLYQLTDVKRRWLARCTTPDLHPRTARITGPLAAGVEHGRCCVACCWTLMTALYALGMMSIPWMVIITVLIVGERLLPRSWPAVIAVAAVLIVLGVAITASPNLEPTTNHMVRMTTMGASDAAAQPRTAGPRVVSDWSRDDGDDDGLRRR